jgi:hypothetical protein
MDFPVPVFTEWFPWSQIDANTQPAIDALLRLTGCYMLARFTGNPPAGPAQPQQQEIFYIGETHGRTTSLWKRLEAFGNSAGFYGGQWPGHYAAWGYPDAFPKDVLGDNADGNGKSCTSERVWVAVCVCQPAIPAYLRGLFPTAIEQQALWAYTAANHDLPCLNNAGQGHHAA